MTTPLFQKDGKTMNHIGPLLKRKTPNPASATYRVLRNFKLDSGLSLLEDDTITILPSGVYINQRRKFPDSFFQQQNFHALVQALSNHGELLPLHAPVAAAPLIVLLVPTAVDSSAITTISHRQEFGRTNFPSAQDQEFLSRRHFEILVELDGSYVIDLGSTNGTFLNKRRLLGGQRYRLYNGDLLMLGSVNNSFCVQFEGSRSSG